MFKRIISLYKNAFGGLSTSAWMLALIMLINRSGSMVLPFLTIYSTEYLGFTIKEAGFILSMFGAGSIAGSLMGGWLTDKTGHFYVQFISLIATGVFFFFVSMLETFWSLGIGVFLLSTIAESLRPANASSVASYANPENVTRAFSLNRMAINLGFAIGPAIGGLLAVYSYKLLFIADGITCIAAGITFFVYFKNKKGNVLQTPVEKKQKKTIYNDTHFLIFIVMCMVFAILFFQFITTLPLYYRNIYKLSEFEIGALMAFNGFIVFLFEMVMVYILNKRFRITTLIVRGTIVVGLSYLLLTFFNGHIFLFVGMFLFSMGEILAMPFMATVVVNRSDDTNRGAYMGFYSFSYSTAIVVAPLVGTYVASNFGYNTLWWCVGGASVFLATGFYYILRQMKY